MVKALTQEQFEGLAQELDQIRDQALAKVGEEDARYIRRLVAWNRVLEISARIALVLGFLHPVFWIVGVLMLAVNKILDNMEIGHNVLHGQYDWMNDPHINSRVFEWDIACDAASWKRTHNYIHHTYTNIIGKDRDFGYGLFRLSEDYPWRPANRWQVIKYALLSLWFEWGVAYHELAGERVFFGKKRSESAGPSIEINWLKSAFYRKARRQLLKDYLWFPLLAGPMFLPVLAGNFIANLIRNLWASTIIFCGHFTEEVHTFRAEDCENETRGQWYYRQILGSSNMTGPKWFHILTGHLSCQVEHHLFPDVPAPRYRAMVPHVQAVAQKYGIPYNTGSFWRQYVTVVQRVIKYSFPTRVSGSERLAISEA